MRFSKFAALAAANIVHARKDSPDERTFAVLRFTNNQIVQTRADPIVSPGVPSTHVHHVMGGSGFSLTSTGEDLMKSNCSNAMVKGDNSNYWFPSLYFKDPKTGELEDVKMFYANVYYFFDNTNDDIKAFPVGLSILVGDPFLRSPPVDGPSANLDPKKGPVNPIRWTCPRKDMNKPAWPPGSDGTKAGISDPNNKGEGVGFPDVDCDGYAAPLRGDIHFPSCYNPAAGLKNYKENMVFPSETNRGKFDCPKGWIHVPHLFLEVYWDTLAFQGRWTPGEGKQPFVLAEGDATGYSNHADFMAGWDEALLQNIIDHCNAGTNGMDKCPGLTHGLNKDHCTIDPIVNEQVTGKLNKLPGNNPITGWSYGGASNGESKPDSSPKPAEPANSAQPPKADKKADEEPKSSGAVSPAAPSSATQPAGSQSPVSTVTPKNLLKNGVVRQEMGNNGPDTKPAAGPHEPACAPKIQTVYETVTVTAVSSKATGGPSEAPQLAVQQPSRDPTSSFASTNSTRTAGGYRYVGCFKDASTRALKGEVRPDLGAISNEKCVKHCKTAGYALAGTEYGGQCYCGNELVVSEKLSESVCNMACEGEKSDTCGGGWALSVYSKDGSLNLKSSAVRRHTLKHLGRRRSLRH